MREAALRGAAGASRMWYSLCFVLLFARTCDCAWHSSQRSACGSLRAQPPAMGERLPVVYPLPDLAAFEREMASAASDGCAMVVSYTQPRCMSCKALEPKLSTFARQDRGDVRLFAVNTLSAGGKDILEVVGQPEALPTVSIYANGELSSTGVVTVKEFSDLCDRIENAVASCSGKTSTLVQSWYDGGARLSGVA